MKKALLLFAVSILIQFAILCRAQSSDQLHMNDQKCKDIYGPFTKLDESTSKCICNFSKSGKIFNDYFKCDEHNGQIHVAIKRGYWIGTRNGTYWNGKNENDLVVGYCGTACRSYGSKAKGTTCSSLNIILATVNNACIIVLANDACIVKQVPILQLIHVWLNVYRNTNPRIY